jgi:hypothetical protein
VRSLILLILVQVIVVDALASRERDTTFNPHRVDIHDRNWCIDIRTGFQKRFFLGAGISKTMFLGSPHGVYGYDMYMAVNVFPSFKDSRETVLGLNAGAMMCGSFGVMGGEVQYMMSKSANDVLFTPKIGIGASMLHVTYGYSFSTNKFPIAGISQNSLTLKFNYPFYTKSLVKREKNK